MNEISLEQLSAEGFAEFIGKVFLVRTQAEMPISLELKTVTPTQQSGAGYESFSLIFEGPAEKFLPQQIYPFEHERIGRFELFIVPVGNENGRFQYQAVFNRQRRRD